MFKKVAAAVLLPIFTYIVNHIPAFVWVIMDFVIDLCLFWMKNVYHVYNSKDELKELLKTLKNVQSYGEWKKTVTEIDRVTNMDLWRQNFISKHYDYILINDRIKLLREARMSEDAQLMMSLLRSGLIRNFGGVSQKRLYTKSYMGTKFKIEEYIVEVLNCLNYLNESIRTPTEKSNDNFIMNSKQLKLDFFHDARQSFGCTALLLQGGSLFGLCHLGVVKALYFKGLLPRVIGGSAVGAAVASLVCTLSDHELIPILLSIADVMKNIDSLNHDVDERYGNIIENVVKKGYSQDILIFLKFVRDTIGDLTFEEAYLKTEKILNIVVHPTHQSVPSLLNYITAPNVIIWTAIYASIGTGVLSDNVQLYVKDFNNNIVPKSPDFEVNFLKPQDVSYQQQYFSHTRKEGSMNQEDFDNNPILDEPNHRSNKFKDQHFNLKKNSPYTRLTELFNVNHFIISLARPYLAPLISNDLKHYHSYGKGIYKTTKTVSEPKFNLWPSLSKGNEPSTKNNSNSFVHRAQSLHQLVPYQARNSRSSYADQPMNASQHTPISKEMNKLLEKGKTSIEDVEQFTKDTGYNFVKHLKNVVGLEIQHRLDVTNKLGLLPDIIKRLCIDEKPLTPQSLTSIREITIVPELRYLLKDFGRVFDVHRTMENIPYWVLVGERSVWPLFPILWTRCSIEFALDDLYNIHRKKS
ncbi:hypothetical protein HYPBUDRAFT_238304 [Hyphopichia burtonii NRRL Y-1933]|uniref:Patatin-like phospholipase domain-containing protein n=1 Tax=Hyphopichia burtonii NRRL Y-1933 TaxID=984485 RepID=A0A1E4RN93_9ASCO|nr:hypothetical protein HYPBUDRAFT_238304 [Hyphopichia burtonii NRRL Y-1933]ODV68565.1 hypothetical protein HYPBUDRAFT_238304 [Hyphopichia burtonii NRRL Y-1933]